jgi:hypothetical protein
VLQRRVTRVTVDAIVAISCSQLDERQRRRRREEKREEKKKRSTVASLTPPFTHLVLTACHLVTSGLQITRSSYFNLDMELMGG